VRLLERAEKEAPAGERQNVLDLKAYAKALRDLYASDKPDYLKAAGDLEKLFRSAGVPAVLEPPARCQKAWEILVTAAKQSYTPTVPFESPFPNGTVNVGQLEDWLQKAGQLKPLPNDVAVERVLAACFRSNRDDQAVKTLATKLLAENPPLSKE